MAIQTAAGAALAVSTDSISAYTASGYGAASYTDVGEISNIGDFLREYQLVTFKSLADRAERKLKGSYNNGTLSPQIALDDNDTGQGMLETARDSDTPIACRITLQDGTIYYMMGLVMSFRPSVGSVDDVVMASCTIEVTEAAPVKV